MAELLEETWEEKFLAAAINLQGSSASCEVSSNFFRYVTWLLARVGLKHQSHFSLNGGTTVIIVDIGLQKQTARQITDVLPGAG